jgi:hypothetical protein
MLGAIHGAVSCHQRSAALHAAPSGCDSARKKKTSDWPFYLRCAPFCCSRRARRPRGPLPRRAPSLRMWSTCSTFCARARSRRAPSRRRLRRTRSTRRRCTASRTSRRRRATRPRCGSTMMRRSSRASSPLRPRRRRTRCACRYRGRRGPLTRAPRFPRSTPLSPRRPPRALASCSPCLTASATMCRPRRRLRSRQTQPRARPLTTSSRPALPRCATRRSRRRSTPSSPRSSRAMAATRA